MSKSQLNKNMKMNNCKQFVKHIEEWENHNVAYSLRDMIDLKKKYDIIEDKI